MHHICYKLQTFACDISGKEELLAWEDMVMSIMDQM